MSKGTEYLEQLLTEALATLATADGVAKELVRDKVLIPECNQLVTASAAIRTTLLFIAAYTVDDTL